jgi:Protein of unknown function (DUF2510)
VPFWNIDYKDGVVINPAGWYPQPDGQQRYWDGQRWTGHRAQGIAVVSLPAKDHRAWFRQRKVIVAAGSVLLLGVYLGVAGGGSGTEAAAAPMVTPVAKSVARPGSAASETQRGQRAFVKAAVTGGIDYMATTNELDRHLTIRTRDRALCEAVPGLVANNWHGTITSLKTGNKDEAILEVEIAPHITVSNQIAGATLIPTASPMYETLAGRSVGEPIQFSGTFNGDDDCPIQVDRWVSREKGMTNPRFSIDFTGVLP